MKNSVCGVFLVSLFTIQAPCLGDVLGNGTSHGGGNRGAASDREGNSAALNTGFGAMVNGRGAAGDAAGGGGGAAKGGAGGAGGGGGAQYKPNADPKALDPTKPIETVKKIEEQTKQFSQTIEKLQSSFTASLSKLTPEDKTAETLKEVNASNEKYAAIGRSNGEASKIVDDIVKGISTQADTQKKQWEAVAAGFTTPAAQTTQTPSGVPTTNRINSLGASNREGNPLAAAIGAEPPNKEHRGFFKGSSAYNPPASAR